MPESGGAQTQLPATTYAGRVQDALADMRSSAKWILGAFAAVAAIVFAGLQLTSLDKINTTTDPWRLLTAMAGFGLTVVGIIGAITVIARFLKREPLTALQIVSPAVGTDRDIRDAMTSIDHDPTILGQFDTAQEVYDALRQNIATIKNSDTSDAARAAAQQDVATLQRILGRVLQRASFVVASRRFGHTLGRVAVWAVVAAVGGGAYALSVAQPGARQARLPTLVRPLTEVTVDFRSDSPHIKAIRKALGSQCPLIGRGGVVLAQRGANSFIVALASDARCRATELSVNARDAVVHLPDSTTGTKG